MIYVQHLAMKDDKFIKKRNKKLRKRVKKYLKQIFHLLLLLGTVCLLQKISNSLHILLHHTLQFIQLQ